MCLAFFKKVFMLYQKLMLELSNLRIGIKKCIYVHVLEVSVTTIFCKLLITSKLIFNYMYFLKVIDITGPCNIEVSNPHMQQYVRTYVMITGVILIAD